MRTKLKRAGALGERIAALLLVAPLAAVVAVLVIIPLGHLLHQSLTRNGGLTLDHYFQVLSVTRHRRALATSLGLSLAVASVSTALCLPTAWLLARHRFRGERFARAVLTLPMTFSGIVVGFLFVALLGRAGFLPQLFERLIGRPWLSGAAYQWPGLLLAYLYFEIPRATLTLEASLRRLDTRLELAAHSLGASGVQTSLWIVLPAIRPALLATLLLTFAVSLGSFGVLLVLSLRRVTLLPLEIFTQFIAPPADRGAAAAMSLVLLAVALGAGWVVRRLSRVEEPVLA